MNLKSINTKYEKCRFARRNIIPCHGDTSHIQIYISFVSFSLQISKVLDKTHMELSMSQKLKTKSWFWLLRSENVVWMLWERSRTLQRCLMYVNQKDVVRFFPLLVAVRYILIRLTPLFWLFIFGLSVCFIINIIFYSPAFLNRFRDFYSNIVLNIVSAMDLEILLCQWLQEILHVMKQQEISSFAICYFHFFLYFIGISFKLHFQ